MCEATSKVSIASSLKGAKFMPESWTLPAEASALETTEAQDGLFMLKPDGGQSGIGIQVCTNTKDMMAYYRAHEEPAVVQRYIEPLLYKGVKWDLRLYVLVASLDPITCYVARPAWCGLCASTWTHPLESTSPEAHIASGNRKVRMEFKEMLAYMNVECDLKEVDVWAQIDALVAESISGIAPAIEKTYIDTFGESGSRPMECFQILGLDLMFGSDGQVWCAEINSNPDMGAKTECDLNVKHAVLNGALDIVCDGVCPETYARVL